VQPGNGATALCNDGTYSYAAHHQGACAKHGGVKVFYKQVDRSRQMGCGRQIQEFRDSTLMQIPREPDWPCPRFVDTGYAAF
jgi:hypothetical protein